MKSVVLYLVLAACLIGAFAEEASQVEVLTKDNFDEKTKEGLWLIKFFAPWCGHCKRLAPTWIELAGKTEGKFHVGEVDCTVEKDLASRFGIRGFPTIKFIANGGAAEDCRVPRTVEAYLEFINGKLGGEKKAEEKPKAAEEKPKTEEEKPKATVLSLTKDNFEAELAKKPLAVKFFAPWCGHCKRLAPTWVEFAEANPNSAFVVAEVDCTAQDELCGKYDIQGYPTIKFLVKGKDAVEFNGARTKEALQSWADGLVKPKAAEEKPKAEEEKPKTAVLSLTKDNFDAELAKKPLAVKFFAPWCGHCKRLAPTWIEFAEANPEADFVVAEVDCTVQKDLCKKYEVHGYPTIKFLVQGQDPVEFNGPRTKDALQKWADGFAKKQHSEL